MPRWILLLSLLAPCPALAASIIDPGQGSVVVPGTAMAELSGIARVSGDRYVAVADSGAQLFSLDVAIDAATGRIASVSSAGSVTLAGGVDLEGVVVRPGGSVLVSDELGAAIREHDPSSGALLGTVAVPPVFGNARSNLSLESLAQRPDGSALWTANEAALTVDGPTATPGAGTWVRLQRFDASLTPDLQLGYQSEPFTGILGVTELLALPGGELLALERTLGIGGFAASVFEVDISGASDTSAVADLSAGGFTPVAKTLLWTSPLGTENFEGMALGPMLDDGDLSLLLVSDGGGTSEPTLYALRLSVPEPSAAVLGLLALAALACSYRR